MVARSKSCFRNLSRDVLHPRLKVRPPGPEPGGIQRAGSFHGPPLEDVVLDGVPSESSSFERPVKKILDEIGLDFHPPDVFDFDLEVVSQEERHPDFVISVADFLIEALQSPDQTRGLEPLFLLEALEQLVVRRKLPERETTPQR